MGQDLLRWITKENIERYRLKLRDEKRAKYRALLENLLELEQARLQEYRDED